MSMINTGDILETIEMFTQDNLDVRTVTMGISLLDCIDPDPKKACEKVYNKITTKAANLVPAVEHISAEYGIPIINKRISVTPIAMLLGACPDADPVDFARALPAKRWASTLWAATRPWCTRAFRRATNASSSPSPALWPRRTSSAARSTSVPPRQA